MGISKYIKDLLFDYECVILPGFGGFVVKDNSAFIDYNKNQFNPPYREIMFNPLLNSNDGLLITHISKKENITFKEAKQKVIDFVHEINKKLDAGERVEFEGVGVIFKDDRKNLIFEPFNSVNFNPESFGLQSFVSPPVERKQGIIIETGYNKVIPENRRVEKEPGRKKSKAVYVYASVLLLLLLIGFTFLFRNDKVSGKLPFFYSNTGSYLANNFDLIPVSGIYRFFSNSWIVKKAFDDDNTEKPVVEEQENKNVEPAENGISYASKSENEETSVDVEQSQTGNNEEKTNLQETDNSDQLETGFRDEPNYFVIAGSFKDRANALKLVSKMKSWGYDALIAGESSSGMTRVAYGKFHSLEEAMSFLEKVKEGGNKSAWILKK